jgi:hypothetical protein
MKRRTLVAIVFLVVILALGIVSVVLAVDAERVPTQSLPFRPVHAKHMPARKPLPATPIPAEPVVPQKSPYHIWTMVLSEVMTAALS